MKSNTTFRLKLGNLDNSHPLSNSKINVIKGKTLSSLGMSVIKPRWEEVYFTIKVKNNNLIVIKNEGRNVLFAKKMDTGFERKLSPGDHFETIDVANMKLYFNKEVSSWQFFHVVKEVDPTHYDEVLKKLSSEAIGSIGNSVLSARNENIINLPMRPKKIIVEDEEEKVAHVERMEPNNIPRVRKIIEDDVEEGKGPIVPRLVIRKDFKKIIDDDEEEKKFDLEESIHLLCNKVKNDQLKTQQEEQIKKAKDSLKKYDNFNENGKRPRPVSDKENAVPVLDDPTPSCKKSLKRLKKNPQNKELILESNVECPICLEKIINLANLDSCVHDFCRSCIEKWAKDSSNNCPICKREFKKIIFYEKNKKLEKRIKKRRLDLEEDEFYFEEYTSTPCLICELDDDDENLLVCDRCEYNTCHYYCDGLEDIPQGEWYCQVCRRRQILRDVVSNNLIEEDEDDYSYEERAYESDDQFSEFIDDFESIGEDLIAQVIQGINNRHGGTRRTNNTRRRNSSRRRNNNR
jgi:hypothetical protein